MRTPGVMRFTIVGLLLALLLGAGAPLRADDWEDDRREKLEEAVQRLEAAETARLRGTAVEEVLDSLVSLRHGRVRMVGDLARADVTLEIRNTGTQPMEWQRTFTLDPRAEAIGAYLQRGDGDPVEAQTLTLDAARRIYGQVRTPRPTRTRPAQRVPSGDPLRLERPTPSRLDIVVWPIAPGETVRVGLDFVTPLRGRGERRTYVDPIQGDLGSTPRAVTPVVTAPDTEPPAPFLAAMDAHWVVDTGRLAPSDLPPTGMVPSGETAGLHHYRAPGSEREAANPRLDLRVLRPTNEVLAVPGGGLGARVATFYFDPIEFVEEHDLTVAPDCTVRILRVPGSTSRIAPWTFEVTGEPQPVTARLNSQSHEIQYVVEVLDPQGEVLHRVPVSRPVNRVRLDKARRGAITGWHRAAVAQRVIDWAAGNPARETQALEFAVDLGVLTAGTAALAVPANERRRLPRNSLRGYWQDGAPLGAQSREADVKAPPSRSTSK